MRKFMQLIILLFIVLIPLRVDAEEPICKHDNSLWHSNWKKIDEAYHSVDCHCNECGKDFTIKEKHDLDYIRTIKKATLLSKGVHQYKCDSCGAILNETFSWSLSQVEDGNAVSYNCSKVSKVYRNSKKITIWLRNPIKGSIIKVKIGKKTYTKKIKTKKKIKIKIKKPKYGKQIGIKIFYKGKLINDDYLYDYCVYYGKKIKKGMTKKQVRYLTQWGWPNYISSSSDGMSYWYYDNGSAVSFKHGKVYKWYKVN